MTHGPTFYAETSKRQTYGAAVGSNSRLDEVCRLAGRRRDHRWFRSEASISALSLPRSAQPPLVRAVAELAAGVGSDADRASGPVTVRDWASAPGEDQDAVE